MLFSCSLLIATHCPPDKSHAPWMVCIIRACAHLIRPISCHSLHLSLITINITCLVISWQKPSFRLCWEWPVRPWSLTLPATLMYPLGQQMSTSSSREPSRSALGCAGCSQIITDPTALQYFGHLMRRTDSLEKILMLGKVEGRGENGMIEDEMVGWHHWFCGHEFEQAPGVGDGQGSLACCSPLGCKESDMTEWTELTALQEGEIWEVHLSYNNFNYKWLGKTQKDREKETARQLI